MLISYALCVLLLKYNISINNYIYTCKLGFKKKENLFSSLGLILCFQRFLLDPDPYNFINLIRIRIQPNFDTDPDPGKLYRSSGSGSTTLHTGHIIKLRMVLYGNWWKLCQYLPPDLYSIQLQHIVSTVRVHAQRVKIHSTGLSKASKQCSTIRSTRQMKYCRKT